MLIGELECVSLTFPPSLGQIRINNHFSLFFFYRLNAAALQVPIGLEGEHKGIVDLVAQKAYVFEGDRGEIIREVPIEGAMQEEVQEKRLEMIERLAEVDDQVAELFLGEEEVPIEVLMESIRRQTIALKFVPVFMGSAFKNKGVQKLLDGVLAYLPNPSEVPNYALDLTQGKPAFPLFPPSLELYSHHPTHTHIHTNTTDEAKVPVLCEEDLPAVALAFKLEEGKFGQLTYMRVYQGTIKRGGWLFNIRNGKKVKVPRLVRMHSNEVRLYSEPSFPPCFPPFASVTHCNKSLILTIFPPLLPSLPSSLPSSRKLTASALGTSAPCSASTVLPWTPSLTGKCNIL